MHDKIVHARPARWLAVACVAMAGVFVCLVPAAALDPKVRHDSLTFLYALFGVVVAFLVLGAIWSLRSAIQADRDGVRWRGMLRDWQGAAWTDIARYRPGSTPKGQPYVRLTFHDGRKLAFDSYWEGFAALSAVVAARAPEGSQPAEEPPPVFRTSPGTIWFQRILFTGGVGFLAYGAIYWPITIVARAYHEGTMGAWVWALALTMEAVILPLAVGSACVAWTVWRYERPARFTVDAGGFTYQKDGKAPWSSAWSETTVRQLWNGMVLETPQGSARITTSMDRYRTAASLIRELTPKAAEVDEPPVEVRGDVRIYPYRHPSYRTFLILPLAIGLSPFLIPLACRAFDLEPPRHVDMGMTAFFQIFTVLGIWGLWRMHAAWIEVDDAGIAQMGLGGTTRLRWSDIDRFEVTGSEIFTFGQLTGARGRIRWWSGLVGEAQLREEIERRRPDLLPKS